MPMLKQKRAVIRGELSMLNAGKTFDIELPIAWNTLTGPVTQPDTLWTYILD